MLCKYSTSKGSLQLRSFLVSCFGFVSGTTSKLPLTFPASLKSLLILSYKMWKRSRDFAHNYIANTFFRVSLYRKLGNHFSAYWANAEILYTLVNYGQVEFFLSQIFVFEVPGIITMGRARGEPNLDLLFVVCTLCKSVQCLLQLRTYSRRSIHVLYYEFCSSNM
jgi:hypothetical protein